MAANFHAVAVRPDEVRVMDHPGAQPQHLAFQRAQHHQAERFRRAGVGQANRRVAHGHILSPVTTVKITPRHGDCLA